jgi:tRNA (guanine37-N1)-methyltransferase
MRAVKVRKELAEEQRTELLRAGVLREGFKPVTDDEHVFFPVEEAYEGDVVEREFEEYYEPVSFRDRVASFLSDEELGFFIHSYDTVGRIAIVQIPEELESKEHRIGKALLESDGGIDTVRKRSSDRGGEFRLRETELLAGEPNTETVHVEHGARFLVDVEKVYFSPRLSTERGRIANCAGENERVLVLFSGCGPFPFVLAKKTGCSVVGVEKNPVGHRLARRSKERFGYDATSFVCADAADYVPESVFDRVVMPAPFNASTFLDRVPLLIETGWVHIYGFVEDEEYESFAQSCVEKLETVGCEARCKRVVVCGQRSPHEERVCADVFIRTC